MVSSPNFGNSLTVSNAASAHYTLKVMTVVALIFTPIVVLYQGWTYHVFRAGSAASSRTTPPRRVARRADPPSWCGLLDPRLLRRARSGAAPARRRHGGRARHGAARARAGDAARADRRPRLPRRLARRRLAATSCCSPSPSPPAALLAWCVRGRRAAGGAWRCCRSFGSRWSSAGCAPSPPRSTASRAARSPPPRCRASRRSRPTSPATCPRPCWPASCRSRCSAWVAPIDLESALIMLVTLPLVPAVHVADRARHRGSARASAGRRSSLLSTHFLDVVRGLPTLRAFNRGRAQATTIAEVSERYRRATMGDAPRQLPLRIGAGAGGDARRRARGRDRRRAAGRRRDRTAGRR